METVHDYLDRLTTRQLGTDWDQRDILIPIFWFIQSRLDNHRHNPEPTPGDETFEEAKKSVALLIKQVEEYLDYQADELSAAEFERFKELERSAKEPQEYDVAIKSAYNVLCGYLQRQDPKRHNFISRKHYETYCLGSTSV